ncbi:reverse transcriptase family protein, partial [Listeria monocytogenes]|uniref:reverse transcriptase family protein n=1 Tax=Listeria monocytogenes TaxID=1639 RepID=UPI0011403E77
EWVSNIVPIGKASGGIRVCVTFRDLNLACPKDDFPLPNIDIIVDLTAGHEMFSLMDGFFGYNQIRIAEDEQHKMTFTTPWETFCYQDMPFGLKNAGATYQCAMTTIFHDLLHVIMEDYVDDILGKSKTRESHIDVLTT